MAASGYVDVEVTSHDTLRFEWWDSGQSVEYNYTNVSWQMSLITDAYGKISSTTSKDWSVNVNGTPYSGTNTVGIDNSTSKVLASGTTAVYHNDDGTKAFSFSFSQEFAITFSGSYVGTKTSSGSGTLNTIPRASSFGMITGNAIGSVVTVEILRNSSSFTHQLWYKVGNSGWYDLGTGIGTSKKFTIDIATCWQVINATSVIMQLCVRTYNGSTQIGSDVYKDVVVYVPPTIKPSATFTVEDTEGYLEQYGAYIQEKSKFKINITATGAYGSTISSYRTIIDGKTYTSESFTTNAIANYGVMNISVTVTDSRGRTTTVSQEVEILAYSAPKIISMSVKRCDATIDENEKLVFSAYNSKGKYLAVIFCASITPLNDYNTAKYEVEYKKVSESSSQKEEVVNVSGKYVVEDTKFVFEADTSSSYDVILTATDAFKSTPRSMTGTSISVLFSALKHGLGLAFGKIAELAGYLEVAYDALFKSSVHVEGALTYDIPACNTNYDCDEMLTSGKFYMDASASNKPENANGWLSVEAYDSGDYCYHKFITCTGDKYERWRNEGVWCEWRKDGTKFIDVTNMIYEAVDNNAYDNSEHTLWIATEDSWCVISAKAYADNQYWATISLDDVPIAWFYHSQYCTAIFPVKKGQTVKKANGVVFAYFYGIK